VSRFVFLRALAVTYLVAFVVAANQFRPLLGQRGLLPIPAFVSRVPFKNAPSVFQFHYSDRFFVALAWLGAALAAAAVSSVTDHAPAAASMAVWLVMWVLYLSIVNVGQTWYSFGWETLLLEAGFLAIFVGPAAFAPPALVLVLIRWLVFRVEFGAGMIKMRGDSCWRDLTCLIYHHETQPMPGPLSWWFHRLPVRVHRAEALGNHLAQLVMPFLLFTPQPVAGVAAAAAGEVVAVRALHGGEVLNEASHDDLLDFVSVGGTSGGSRRTSCPACLKSYGWPTSWPSGLTPGRVGGRTGTTGGSGTAIRGLLPVVAGGRNSANLHPAP